MQDMKNKGVQAKGMRDIRILPTGTVLGGRYQIRRVLGIGGFGITYAAQDKRDGSWAAVKEYFPAEWAHREAQGRLVIPKNAQFKSVYLHGQEVFLNEARVLHSLHHLPGVVNVRGYFEENRTAYMVMELLDGDTLSGYMKKRGIARMPYQRAGEIIRNVGESLIQIHNRMLLHRDIGPDNIMITRTGEVKLIDFGATRMYALNSEKSMSVLVKPGFAPIEQYSRSGNQGPWTDVYALAATYYFLVTGRKPPEAPERVAGMKLMPICSQIPDVPARVDRAIAHAMEESWRKRTKNVRGFLRELEMLEHPRLLMRTQGKSVHYDFMPDDTLSIGRRVEKNILLRDMQVSGLHCKIWYDATNQRFVLKNYSANCTYTCKGVLGKNQKIILANQEWFYIQTARTRYVFYPEVK